MKFAFHTVLRTQARATPLELNSRTYFNKSNDTSILFLKIYPAHWLVRFCSAMHDNWYPSNFLGLTTLFISVAEPEPPFLPEPEPTQFGRSWSRLRDFGLPEPEPPKKVAAPEHCFSSKHKQLGAGAFSPAPAIAKKSGSGRLQLHNTGMARTNVRNRVEELFNFSSNLTLLLPVLLKINV